MLLFMFISGWIFEIEKKVCFAWSERIASFLERCQELNGEESSSKELNHGQNKKHLPWREREPRTKGGNIGNGLLIVPQCEKKITWEIK